MSYVPDETALFESYELERRIDRDLEREVARTRPTRVARSPTMLNNRPHAEGRLDRLTGAIGAQARARSSRGGRAPLARAAMHAGAHAVLGGSR